MIKPTEASSEGRSPAVRYFGLIRDRFATIRHDLPSLIEMGQDMAELLLAGGELSAAPVARYWGSEFCSRAGGLMRLRSPAQATSQDVVYLALPDPRRSDTHRDELLRSLMDSKAQLFVNGRPEDLPPSAETQRFAGFAGGADPQLGLYGTEQFRPLVPVRHFDQIVRGWIAAGELIAHCTRAGRMPVIWMSIWLEGALVRNASLLEHTNLGEPWETSLFHNDFYVPPIPAGHAGESFLDSAEGILAVLESQFSQLARAGQWLAEGKRQGKRLHVVATGHSYPAILEIPKGADYPLQWGGPVSNLQKAVPASLGDGDVFLHLGYAPVDVGHVGEILDRGVRFIHTSPYGRPAALEDHENFVWLDSPWRPGDATVDVPGYSVRIMPMSSTAHTMVYSAIICEMAERMGWQ